MKAMQAVERLINEQALREPKAKVLRLPPNLYDHLMQELYALPGLIKERSNIVPIHPVFCGIHLVRDVSIPELNEYL